ncbi:unnamed protein product [Medioppia subpectinata]|uniref:Uncharacterized protein n=1 Tax=Medioppia subpectinata TaxID=1979941 RepID=A0A7R9QGP2_9ACAR|nr:unnamed protein product [Medioppia subpectinata]CAG2120413.1 unnamed protein product [Medioppia subpectinata]
MILLSSYAIRSIRYVTLAPGGHTVRLTTFSVTGAPNRYRHYDVPLTSVSSHVSRSDGGVMPIKVKGKWFYYILDTKKGQFLRPKLFDETVGTFRVLK